MHLRPAFYVLQAVACPILFSAAQFGPPSTLTMTRPMPGNGFERYGVMCCFLHTTPYVHLQDLLPGTHSITYHDSELVQDGLMSHRSCVWCKVYTSAMQQRWCLLLSYSKCNTRALARITCPCFCLRYLQMIWLITYLPLTGEPSSQQPPLPPPAPPPHTADWGSFAWPVAINPRVAAGQQPMASGGIVFDVAQVAANVVLMV